MTEIEYTNKIRDVVYIIHYFFSRQVVEGKPLKVAPTCSCDIFDNDRLVYDVKDPIIPNLNINRDTRGPGTVICKKKCLDVALVAIGRQRTRNKICTEYKSAAVYTIFALSQVSKGGEPKESPIPGALCCTKSKKNRWQRKFDYHGELC